MGEPEEDFAEKLRQLIRERAADDRGERAGLQLFHKQPRTVGSCVSGKFAAGTLRSSANAAAGPTRHSAGAGTSRRRTSPPG